MTRSGKSQITNKKFWVTAKWIIKATGWDKNEMRQAREKSLIEWRHTEEEGFLYNLNSIHSAYLKNTQNA